MSVCAFVCVCLCVRAYVRARVPACVPACVVCVWMNTLNEWNWRRPALVFIVSSTGRDVIGHNTSRSN